MFYSNIFSVTTSGLKDALLGGLSMSCLNFRPCHVAISEGLHVAFRLFFQRHVYEVIISLPSNPIQVQTALFTYAHLLVPSLSQSVFA